MKKIITNTVHAYIRVGEDLGNLKKFRREKEYNWYALHVTIYGYYVSLRYATNKEFIENFAKKYNYEIIETDIELEPRKKGFYEKLNNILYID